MGYARPSRSTQKSIGASKNMIKTVLRQTFMAKTMQKDFKSFWSTFEGKEGLNHN